MVRERMWTREHAFAAFYFNKESPDMLSIRDVAQAIKNEYGKVYSRASVDRMIDEVEALFAAGGGEVKTEYEKVKQELTTGKKYFWRYDADGKVDSPYESVVNVAKRIYGRKNRYPAWFAPEIKRAEKFWLHVGKKKPEDWTEHEYHDYIATVPRGSKFSVTTAIRQYGKQLKDIEGLTLGLKSPPRKPKVLKLPDFPKIYRQIIAAAIEIAKPEEKEEIEFILTIKPRIGIRTGDRATGKGFLGTKVGGEWKNKYGETAAYVQVIGDNFIWSVFEKKDEYWDINFYSGATKKRIINFVKKRQAGDWLLNMSSKRANQLSRHACLAVGIAQVEKDKNGNVIMETKDLPAVVNHLILHDLRKVYISFMVRAGIRLEQAITFNVGWKDIGTAAKHYLEFSEFGEKLEKKKVNFAAVFNEDAAGGSDDSKLPRAVIVDNSKIKLLKEGEEAPEDDEEEDEE